METRERPVATLGLDDVDSVAAIHCAAFPRSALTQLGKEAVSSYYRWVLTGPYEIYAHGIRSDKALAGFCFGGIAPTAMTGFLRRNSGLLASRLVTRPLLIVDPIFRHRLQRGIQTLLRAKRRSQPAAPVSTALKHPYDILSIAVNPSYQGMGFGKTLMEHAQTTARQNGFHVMTLMVNTDNEQAIAFYESMGWEKLLMKGVWRGNMEKWFGSRPKGPSAGTTL